MGEPVCFYVLALSKFIRGAGRRYHGAPRGAQVRGPKVATGLGREGKPPVVEGLFGACRVDRCAIAGPDGGSGLSLRRRSGEGLMRIRLGCELSYDFPKPTPMIVMLNVHYSRAASLEYPDHLMTVPPVPIQSYRDSFGNWCCRLVAPAGRFTLGTDTVIHDDSGVDPVDRNAVQHRVEELPSEVLVYLLGSRYCETDLLSEEAWRLFSGLPLGWARVEAICDFVHRHVLFGYEHSRATRTAAEAYAEGRGVCRDYAHLAITFCRCLNIPARYCMGYIVIADGRCIFITFEMSFIRIILLFYANANQCCCYMQAIISFA